MIKSIPTVTMIDAKGAQMEDLREYEQKAREIEQREAEVMRRELRYQASEALKKRGLPVEFANLIGASDESEIASILASIPAMGKPPEKKAPSKSPDEETDEEYYRRIFGKVELSDDMTDEEYFTARFNQAVAEECASKQGKANGRRR